MRERGCFGFVGDAKCVYISRLTRVNQKEVKKQTLHSSIQEEEETKNQLFFRNTKYIFCHE